MKNVFNFVKKWCLDTGLYSLTSYYHYSKVVAESDAYRNGINKLSLAWEFIKAKCTVDSWRGLIPFAFTNDWVGQEQSLNERTEPSAAAQRGWDKVVAQLEWQIAEKEAKERNESVCQLVEETKLQCQGLSQATKNLGALQQNMCKEAAARRVQLHELMQGANELDRGVAALSSEVRATSRDVDAFVRDISISREVAATAIKVKALSIEVVAEASRVKELYSEDRLAYIQSCIEQISRAQAQSISQNGNLQNSHGTFIVETAYDSDYEGQPFPDDNSVEGSELTIASGPSQ